MKRNCLKVLPHTLVIHLKRFEFDYETMTRWKIKDRRVSAVSHFPVPLNSAAHTSQPCSGHSVLGLSARQAAMTGCAGLQMQRQRRFAPPRHEEVHAESPHPCFLTQQTEPCRFEFPKELDMYKYTVDGLAAKEAADAAAAAAGSSPAAPNAAGPQGGALRDAAGNGAGPAVEPPGTPRPPQHDQQYQYTLKGIVVHSGTAFAGHYYSYIKVRAWPLLGLSGLLALMETPSTSPGSGVALWGSPEHASSGAAQVRKQAGQGSCVDQWLCYDDNTVSSSPPTRLQDAVGILKMCDLPGTAGTTLCGVWVRWSPGTSGTSIATALAASSPRAASRTARSSHRRALPASNAASAAPGIMRSHALYACTRIMAHVFSVGGL